MMDQRPLRLGDRIDDYCPRERRLTNHVVTVMQGDEITHTRCTACDADHAYKHAKIPARKKTSDTGALYDAVLAGVLKPKRSETVAPVDAAEMVPADVAPSPVPAAEPEPEPAPVAVAVAPEPEPVVAAAAATPGDLVAEPEAEPEPATASWGHRPLIRATLPRPDGQAPSTPRPIPEFTMHHRHNGHSGGQGRRHQGGGFGRQRDQGRGNGRSRFSR